MEDMFLEGNEKIENAIRQFYTNECEENLISILETIRQRMHEDGHFILPVLVYENEPDRFAFQTIESMDGKIWNAAFTSMAEFEKGEKTNSMSYFIDSSLQVCLGTEIEGFVINPWGQAFMLTQGMIEKIFEADGDVEYHVPEDPVTEELLEDGSYLKRAARICSRNQTFLNLLKLSRILRDSNVWVPCQAVLSDSDYEAWTKLVRDAMDKGNPDSIVGTEVRSQDNIRLVPDILQNGEDFFFPVFTSEEEMGEYGKNFSHIGSHFLKAMDLARNNEKNVKGIVINAFTEPFLVPVEMFDTIACMESSLEKKESDDHGKN